MNGKSPISLKGLRFTNVRLANWRNFAHADVSLAGRVFLIGPNASGKSNFLDAFRFLHDLVALGGGFQEAITKRGGVSKLRSLAARRYPDVEIAVSLGTDEVPNIWTYEVTFTQDNRQRPLLRREVVKSMGTTLIRRPDEDDRNDPARLQQTHIEQVNVNRSFRDLADFLRTVRYVHLVPQLVRETDRYVGRDNDPFGSDFLEQVAKTQDRTRSARLRKIAEGLKVAVPQLQELQFFRDEAKGTPHLRGKYEHWRSLGAWQTEEQFSDGTLRLLALLWAVLDGSGPLLLEEPELSLHPEVVRYLPQLFARLQRRTGRQVLLSSHSADLLRDEGIALDEVLLLRPKAEGTRVELVSQLQHARALVEGGLPLPDALIPETRPPRAAQLSLFGD
ncbi:AAA family ATPase [Mesorhizobium sp. C277A]|uniref:AAA family ATPase n=1 Tax=Mesorhizobium sp. C277A TaxID=2956827 RepID=UPI0004086C83|nr:ATP-binding protein [Mesorhizobium sp. LSJC277A00]